MVGVIMEITMGTTTLMNTTTITITMVAITMDRFLRAQDSCTPRTTKAAGETIWCFSPFFPLSALLSFYVSRIPAFLDLRPSHPAPFLFCLLSAIIILNLFSTFLLSSPPPFPPPDRSKLKLPRTRNAWGDAWSRRAPRNASRQRPCRLSSWWWPNDGERRPRTSR